MIKGKEELKKSLDSELKKFLYKDSFELIFVEDNLKDSKEATGGLSEEYRNNQ